MASCIQSPVLEHGHFRIVSNKQLKVQDKSVNICELIPIQLSALLLFPFTSSTACLSLVQKKASHSACKKPGDSVKLQV